MALIKCDECGREISSEAEFCPHCGKPSSVIRCPICKSTNISTMSNKTSFAVALSNIFMAGPMAQPVKRNTCRKCGHKW
jgi:predicted amidophosphoribosyltransferase